MLQSRVGAIRTLLQCCGIKSQTKHKFQVTQSLAKTLNHSKEIEVCWQQMIHYSFSNTEQTPDSSYFERAREMQEFPQHIISVSKLPKFKANPSAAASAASKPRTSTETQTSSAPEFQPFASSSPSESTPPPNLDSS